MLRLNDLHLSVHNANFTVMMMKFNGTLQSLTLNVFAFFEAIRAILTTYMHYTLHLVPISIYATELPTRVGAVQGKALHNLRLFLMWQPGQKRNGCSSSMLTQNWIVMFATRLNNHKRNILSSANSTNMLIHGKVEETHLASKLFQWGHLTIAIHLHSIRWNPLEKIHPK